MFVVVCVCVFGFKGERRCVCDVLYGVVWRVCFEVLRLCVECSVVFACFVFGVL